MTDPAQLLFHPAYSEKRDSEDERTRSMVAHLGQRCERLIAPADEEFIDYRERRSEWWAARAGGRKLPAAIEQLAAGGVLVDPRCGGEAAAIPLVFCAPGDLNDCACESQHHTSDSLDVRGLLGCASSTANRPHPGR